MTCPAADLDNDRHDFTQPPHHGPAAPNDYTASAAPACQHQGGECNHTPPCTGACDYLVVVYSPGTHDWIRIGACAPCAARLRARCAVARVTLA